MKAILLSIILWFSAQDILLTIDEESSAIQLGSRLELFVDHYLIDTLINTRLVLQKPLDEGPVLTFGKPWEGAFCGYFTIIKDRESYRAYYRGIPEAGKDGNSMEITCYAESKDGIHWEKPNLGLFEINGSIDNNVILANAAPVTHNFSPFLDTNPTANKSQRYKALGGTQKSGLIAYTSEDGIRWQKLQEKPVFSKGAFDSQNVSFWSENEKSYICYFRTWTEGEYKGFRTVSRTTSKDFVQWTDPVKMSFGDTPYEHLYTSQTHPYFRAPHIYVAIAARFMPGRQVLTEEQALLLDVNPKYFKDCSDVVFMTSRGGSRYERTFMESFIRPNIGLQNWVSRSNYPALNVVQTGPAEMSVYVQQDYAQPTAYLRRYSMRLDGFASVSASYKGGEMVTKPFTFSGEKLNLNFATSAAGEIRVEVQDADGRPIPGYLQNDSQILIGNEIDRTVAWNNSEDIGKLSGKSIRLRFIMKDADLFAMRFN